MFFYHPRVTSYDFGGSHPLRPERLRRTMALLGRLAPDLSPVDPGLARREDLERVHSPEYVDVVERLSRGDSVTPQEASQSGFTSGDNPAFAGMYEASLAYCAGAVFAAEAVRDGCDLAFNLAGGLHHARRSQASGFCVFNDCAIALSVLRDRFSRVAYVDIDLHHGDGVQWIFWEDPTVLTCSIHESGRYLYPGTGFVDEVGANATKLNVPLEPHTTGDVWLGAFERTVMPALELFSPQAVVLQMGADAHFLDPLGHLAVAAQEWLQAVRLVKGTGLPIVALGGGGYEMSTVPRMWAAAVLTLLGREPVEPVWTGDEGHDTAAPGDGLSGGRLGPPGWALADLAPAGLLSDPTLPEPRGVGAAYAESVVADVRAQVLQTLR